MAPPGYGDLGKASRDVFGKGFHFGLVKLDVKTKTSTGVEFASSGSSAIDTGKVSGNLETKYKCSEYGVTITEKWSTDNQLATTIDLQDKVMKGLKLTFDSTFSPDTGAKTGKIKADLKHDVAAISADCDVNMGGPLINASAVIGHKGWLAGYQMAFDSAKSKLTKNNLSVGYSTGDFVLHTNVNDGAVFGGSIYHKVNPQMETGINLGWTASSNTTTFGIGGKYVLDKDASIRAKINNSSQIGLGYQQKLRDGLTVTLSTLVDGKNFNQGGHKIGLAIEMES